MKTIKFVVNGQNIELDTGVNTDSLVPGTEDYVNAEFRFSPDWRSYTKIAAFYSMLGREYRPSIIVHDVVTDTYSCDIPVEALAKRRFKIQIQGKRGDTKLITNKFTVSQNGGTK